MTRSPLYTALHACKCRCVAIAVILVVLLVFGSRRGLAQAIMVPAPLQAEVLAKLVSYDRNFASRAGQTARVLLVTKHTTRSALSAAAMKSALGQLETIGGLPHQETIVRYEGAAALAKLCREQHAAILYITPDFEMEISAIRVALTGVDVLSVSAVPDYIPKGIVLGFELVSSKPKLVLNLSQAKQQNVDFKANVLRLMRVYR